MQPQPAVVENKPAAATTWANLLFTKQQVNKHIFSIGRFIQDDLACLERVNFS